MTTHEDNVNKLTKIFGGKKALDRFAEHGGLVERPDQEALKEPWVSTSVRLPEMNVYVVIHHTRETWEDKNDQEGCECVVACRKDIRDDLSSYSWKWSQFGPDAFPPHQVDRWMPIPRTTR